MADTKISALTELTDVQSGDLFVVVDDPGGSPVTKKITLENLRASSFSPSTVDGRLTLSSATPVPTTTVTGSSVYLTPYSGNKIGLYDGTVWSLYSFSEITLGVTGTPVNTNFDVFAYASGSSVLLEQVKWTDNTTRATALATQNGIYVKNGDATRRYLGTCRTGGVENYVEDSTLRRFVWNYYNRVERHLTVTNIISHTYNGAYRLWNNSTANNLLEWLVGVNEVPLHIVLNSDNYAPSAKFSVVVPYINGAAYPGTDTGAYILGGIADLVEKYQGKSYVSPNIVGYSYMSIYESGNDNAATFVALHFQSSLFG